MIGLHNIPTLIREQFLAEIDKHDAQFARKADANKIIKPLSDAIRTAKRSAQRNGIWPTIVCLGEAQHDLLDKYDEVSLAPASSGTRYYFRMRIIWTGDADLVAVYEEREGAWV